MPGLVILGSYKIGWLKYDFMAGLSVAAVAIPIAVLSAVIVNSAIGLFDIDGLRKLRKISPREFRLSLITLLGVITVGINTGDRRLP